MKSASLFFLILSVLCYLLIGVARAQVPTCDSTVPFYTADMTGSPHGTWISPSHSRVGNCCSTSGADRCTSFRIITDTAAVLMKLEIIDGAIPSGALYYQIGCGAMIPMGAGVWLSGGATYDITFCKPGNNENVYAITWYSKEDTVVTGTFSAYTCGQTDLDIGVPGGVWSSSNTSVATVDASTGVVTGVSAGTTNISYVLDAVLLKVVTVTINAMPPITGTFTVCVGGTTDLSGSSVSGDLSCDAWSSSNTARATVSSSGVVSGISVGTATITYTTCEGCATAVVTVTQIVPSVTGGPVCVGATTTMANATSGGTWSIGSVGVATIDSGSGIATGISPGTASITYTITGGCRNSGILTVNTLPTAISGSSAICSGKTTTLTDTTLGGTWSSSNMSIAMIDPSSGVLSGLAAGTITVTYTAANGCTATKVMTINGTPVISGIATLCMPSTISLSGSIAGGTWSSSNTSRATINSATGVVTGVSNGTSVITYQLSTGCMDADVITVSTPPSAISGASVLCSGNTITLADATPGGTWSTSDGSIGTINSSGVFSGIAAGIVNAIYTAGGCYATKAVTVNGTPVISGSTQVCRGSTVSLSSSIAGGTWSSSNGKVSINSATGVATGNTVGTATISYQMATGCNAGFVMTVNSLPSAISGSTILCAGSTTTLTDATAGGTWSTSNGSVATIGSSSGVLLGVAAGTGTVTYTSAVGCNATRTITINGTPVIAIATPVCVGLTESLSSSIAGGTWTSGNTSKATINSSTGVATGVAAGTAAITYQLATGCNDVDVLTVNAPPAAISGSATLCAGSTTTLTDVTVGGTWSSSNGSVATIGSSSGILSGIGAGTASVTYSNAPGCNATKVITINGTPVISATMQVCVSSIDSLSASPAGGTWSSSNTGVAAVGSSSGVATGVAAGTASITYQLATGCKDVAVLTVNPQPAAISGSLTLCASNSITFSDATAGGTWSSKNTSIATVDSVSGVVTGVAAGQTYISYIIPTGCWTRTQVTVNATPVISGTMQVCESSTASLSGNIAGGSWSSSNPGVATIGSSAGVATGVAAGTSAITYQLATGCYDADVLTVNGSPAISGPATLCVGATITLDAIAGGTWSSSDGGVASVGPSSGVLSGLIAGTTSITYTTAVGCTATMPITINANPVISGGQLCMGSLTTLSGSIGGGAWSSSNTAVATVGSSSGIATGIAAGTTTITYLLPTGCKNTNELTVNPAPAAISGPLTMCGTNSVTLSDATAGGVWNCKNLSIATVDSVSGVVTGVSTGQVYISYILPTGCWARSQVTVNTMPVITNADPSVCVAATITMNASIAGGTWSSNNIAIAPIDASGMVTGASAGNAIITYQLSNGCMDTAQVAVGSLPVAISGAPTLCSGTSATYTNSIAGGNWTCSDTSVGCINASTGLFNCTGSGSTNIMYATAAGCSATKSVTVNPRAAITGPDFMCIHLTAQLASSMTGGAWSSSIPDTASVDASGLVTGLGQGTVLISYTTAQGCVSTKQERVNNYYYPLETQPLSTPMRTNICLGNTLGLNSPLGGDGHWVTSDSTKATVSNLVHGSPDPWGVVHALALGTVTISYTGSNGCTSTHTITINPMPVITSTPPTICRYGYTTLNATPAGGQWISHQLTICQVTSWTGIVHASTVGVAEIAYRLYTYDQCGYNILCTVNICTPKEQGGSVDPNSISYSIYPNPGSGAFTISQDVVADQSLNAVVTNCVGQAVYNGKISFIGGVATLDLPDVSPGIYMVQLDDKPEGKTMLRVAVQ